MEQKKEHHIPEPMFSTTGRLIVNADTGLLINSHSELIKKLKEEFRQELLTSLKKSRIYAAKSDAAAELDNFLAQLTHELSDAIFEERKSDSKKLTTTIEDDDEKLTKLIKAQLPLVDDLARFLMQRLEKASTYFEEDSPEYQKYEDILNTFIANTLVSKEEIISRAGNGEVIIPEEEDIEEEIDLLDQLEKEAIAKAEALEASGEATL